jgi:hypothetical protein
MKPPPHIGGQGASVQAPNQSTAPSVSLSYLSSAHWMMNGAIHLASGPTDCAIACASLAAQALECTLKAYISHSGVGERVLRDNKVRHNLEVLWERAVQNQLRIETRAPSWCTLLNTAHNSPYFFRYPMGLNGMVTPVPAAMVAGLRDVVEAVRTAIGIPPA